MAKITLSPIFQEIRGKLGDFVFRRTHTGEVILSKIPDMSKVKWSKAQKAHRQRFRKAVAYAKAALAAKMNKRPFDMAVSDYFKGNDLLSKKETGS